MGTVCNFLKYQMICDGKLLKDFGRLSFANEPRSKAFLHLLYNLLSVSLTIRTTTTPFLHSPYRQDLSSSLKIPLGMPNVMFREMHTARAFSFSKNVRYSNVCALQIFKYFITLDFSKVIVLNCIVLSATSTFLQSLGQICRNYSVIKIKGQKTNYALARFIIVDTSSHTRTSPGIN